MDAADQKTAEELSDPRARQLIPGVRAKLENLYSAVRKIPNVPYQRLDYLRDQMLRRAGAASSPREAFGILQEGIALLESWSDPENWPTTQLHENLAAQTAAAQVAGAQVRALGMTFNPNAFLASLHGRGVIATLDESGKIVISPADALNATDRQQLRNHRAAIVDALSNTEIF